MPLGRTRVAIGELYNGDSTTSICRSQLALTFSYTPARTYPYSDTYRTCSGFVNLLTILPEP